MHTLFTCPPVIPHGNGKPTKSLRFLASSWYFTEFPNKTNGSNPPKYTKTARIPSHHLCLDGHSFAGSFLSSEALCHYANLTKAAFSQFLSIHDVVLSKINIRIDTFQRSQRSFLALIFLVTFGKLQKGHSKCTRSLS